MPPLLADPHLGPCLAATGRLNGRGDGTTLLHLASGVGIVDLARRVLAQRADVGQEHRAFGSPLLLAAERGGRWVAGGPTVEVTWMWRGCCWIAARM